MTDNPLRPIADIFLRRGADSYLDEAVTMSQHMYQCAMLAEQDGCDAALVAACLLHDIGHYAGDVDEHALGWVQDDRHEEAGGALLARLFPPEVSEPVRLHVAAKRYLCAVEPGYFEQLSPASVHSLELQGGPMDEQEAADFAAGPHAEAAVKLRRYDEAAKHPEVRAPGFDHWHPLLARLLVTR